MEAREAVLTILREQNEPMHWTKIQDLALRRGYLDPFETRDVRGAVLKALAHVARSGEVVRRGKGVYALPEP
ncbi:MAG: hypothetical protein HY240_01315 [Actinobacteria bacterium]|nr:hypothetical protein [Actinomycetota bacterium]